MTWKPAAPLSVRGLILPSVADLRRNLGRFIIFGALFTLLDSVVLVPVFAVLFRLMLYWGGDRVVGNEEVLRFLVSPAGVAALLVAIVSVLTTVLTRQAGLMILFAHVRTRRPIGALRALVAMLRKLPGILVINLGRAVLLLLVLLPFAGIGAWLYFRFLSGYDLNYLVQVRPPAFWWAASVGGLLAVGAVLAVFTAHTRVILIFPVYFFEGVPLLEALRRGSRMVRGQTVPLVRLFVVWTLCTALCNLALGALLDRLELTVVPLAGSRLDTLVVWIAVLLALQVCALAALNLFFRGVNAIAVFHAFATLSGGAGRALSAGERVEDRYRRRRILAVAAVIAVLLGGAGWTTYTLVEQSDLRDSVRIIAHRGSSEAAPENTLASIARAIEDGADFAEIDVQETRDGTVVVIHDTDLKRITGLDAKIWEVSYDEIRDLDFGSWFSPQFSAERIPTLDQAIELADGRIGLNIELKLNGHEQQLVQRVVRIVEEHGFAAQCILTSLSREAIDQVQRLDPQLQRGYIAVRAVGEIDRVDAERLVLNETLATALTIGAAHEAGKPVDVWTVNDPMRMSFLIDRGADGILTDRPAVLADVIRQRAELSDLERLVLRFAELVSR